MGVLAPYIVYRLGEEREQANAARVEADKHQATASEESRKRKELEATLKQARDTE
jgi:hypothetical protein